MKAVCHRGLVVALITAVCSIGLSAENTVQLVVRADQPGAKISPTMYGIFFEDINFGADGGLYAELVKNRSFEFPEPLMGWSEDATGTAVGSLRVLDKDPLNPANPHYLRISTTDAESGYGIANDGFAGIGVRKGEEYSFSVFARGDKNAVLRVELVTKDTMRVLAKAKISGFRTGWTRKSATLRPRATDAHARLRVLLQTWNTAVDLDMVSLFPKKTWKDRPNGLRADLVQWLADLKPGFLRFPGGCIVEGRYLEHAVPVEEHDRQTGGAAADHQPLERRVQASARAGLLPDVRARLLRVLPAVRGHRGRAAADPQLRHGLPVQLRASSCRSISSIPYIQDALDLIEFANGPATSTWGAKRAAMGHPKPFNMKMLGVGNEQWGPQYIERYVPFVKAHQGKVSGDSTDRRDRVRSRDLPQRSQRGGIPVAEAAQAQCRDRR